MSLPYHDELLAEVDSTNRRARELAESGVPHGSGVRAEFQSAGRGRLNRHWHSPKGKNLYCSFVLRPSVSRDRYPLLTMVAGVATAALIEPWTPEKVGLKWPNDVFVGGKKCGGILCEACAATASNTSDFVIVGIGLNLNMTVEDLPAELLPIATSLVIAGSGARLPGEVYGKLREKLLEYVDIFQREGFKQILRRWRIFDILADKRTSWVSQSGAIVTGISLGPGNDGMLRIEDDYGQVHTVVSGDVSLVRPDTTGLHA